MPVPTRELDVLDLVLQSRGVVFVVLVLLCGFSLACWWIIGFKVLYLRRAERQTRAFLEAFWQSRRLDAVYQTAGELPASPVAQMFKAGYIELGKLKAGGQDGGEGLRSELGALENVERSLGRAQLAAVMQIESMVPFLATTGSTAPFVGLFGTVWGIMNSFRSIGAAGSAGLAVVAPGIAEALVATAIGLVAAIPAVMAYNYFVRRIRLLTADMDTFTKDFLNIVRRHFLT
ncbi:MAG: protein TolQ [Myxococcota bacterium]